MSSDVPTETIIDDAREVAAFLDKLQIDRGLTDRECTAILKLVNFWRVNR